MGNGSVKISSTCVVCNTPSGKYRKQIDKRYSVIKCQTCGLEYTDPAPGNDELKAFYSEYTDIRADRMILEMNSKEHLKTLKRYGWTPESRTLDFGAGEGVFVETAGGCTSGVDVKPSNPSIKSSLDDGLNDVKWNFITLFGVLEHLPDPLQIMNGLVSILGKDGKIAITTVNAEGNIPYYYKPPEHLTYWTRAAFEMMCDTLGMKIIEYRPYWMFQLGQIYMDRLLSRTPKEYVREVSGKLPAEVYVPTNEIFCLLGKNK